MRPLALLLVLLSASFATAQDPALKINDNGFSIKVLEVKYQFDAMDIATLRKLQEKIEQAIEDRETVVRIEDVQSFQGIMLPANPPTFKFVNTPLPQQLQVTNPAAEAQQAQQAPATPTPGQVQAVPNQTPSAPEEPGPLDVQQPAPAAATGPQTETEIPLNAEPAQQGPVMAFTGEPIGAAQNPQQRAVKLLNALFFQDDTQTINVTQANELINAIVAAYPALDPRTDKSVALTNSQKASILIAHLQAHLKSLYTANAPTVQTKQQELEAARQAAQEFVPMAAP